MKDKQERFESFARSVLDEAVAGTDAKTRSRLHQMRHKALDSSARKHSTFVVWGGASGLAAVALAAILIWMQPVQQDGEILTAVIDDVELLASDDDVELLENLDFYQWLEADDVQG
ncbi:MAG: hypothetical protein R8L58_03505 [Mariprofundaceae bacterium]